MDMKGKNVVLGVTGGIAAYRAAEVRAFERRRSGVNFSRSLPQGAFSCGKLPQRPSLRWKKKRPTLSITALL